LRKVYVMYPSIVVVMSVSLKHLYSIQYNIYGNNFTGSQSTQEMGRENSIGV
jgi:hypothetical protein